MKKQVITVAMLMVSMGYTLAGTMDYKKDTVSFTNQIKVLPSEKAFVYNLFYSSDQKGMVNVNIYNSSGTRIHSSNYRKEDAENLKSSFDFGNLPSGTYTFEVINKGLKTTEKVNHVLPVKKMDISVTETGVNGKYSLNVLRNNNKPVYIKIYDNNYNIIHEEVVDVASSFNVIYDLSKLPSKDVTFDVYCNGSKFFKKIQ